VLTPSERSEAAREAALTRWYGEKRCVNATDRCDGSFPCPYCERTGPASLSPSQPGGG
jgi:hypothetical protein